MYRKKLSKRCRRKGKRQHSEQGRQKNSTVFKSLLEWFVPEGELFSEDGFHGNIKWKPEHLAAQALIWSWQDTENVTDAFGRASEICEEVGMKNAAETYAGFMGALKRYGGIFKSRLRGRTQELAEDIGGRFWRCDQWLLIGFDGSRVSTPRTASNEKAFCASNYGNGTTAKYREKKTKGMRRSKNEKNKPQPQAPQAWITMMWHMGLRLPWTWRLGPSNSSERGHVMEILDQEEFPENTLFCGDAGFVGYPLWNAILSAGGDFLIRVGANVSLLSEHTDLERCSDGTVLCWPKDKIKSGAKPLRLRLVKVKIGKTMMWMLTSALDRKKFSKKQIVRYYRMRWGIEVEFRGLKQTLDNRKLRCRDSERVLVELDWSIRAMAIAELMALREQIPSETESESQYDTKDRSLANTIRALRKCMRNLHKYPKPGDELLVQIARALVQKYKNRTDKRARYCPRNPDKKPLGDPKIRKLTAAERRKLRKISNQLAA